MIATPFLNERFCKDCKIPIKIFYEPYFSDRLELTDPLYNAKEKYARFLSSIVRYHSEQEYMEDYNQTKDAAIRFITERPQYFAFQNEKVGYFAAEPTVSVPKKDIYKSTLVGHRMVSVDMKQANFRAMLYFDTDMFGGAKTWEDFIRQFTDNEHIVQSKYIREVILGNCTVQRQIALERKLTCNLFNTLNAAENPAEPVYLSNDEIVFDITNCDDPEAVIRFIEDKCNEWAKTEGKGIIALRIEPFTLWQVSGTKGYIRNIESADGNILDLKCVTSKMMPFVIRALNNEEVVPETDAVFVDDNKLLAMYVQVPEIKIIKN